MRSASRQLPRAVSCGCWTATPQGTSSRPLSGQRGQLVEGDGRLEVGDAGDDRQRELRGERRCRAGRFGRRRHAGRRFARCLTGRWRRVGRRRLRAGIQVDAAGEQQEHGDEGSASSRGGDVHGAIVGWRRQAWIRCSDGPATRGRWLTHEAGAARTAGGSATGRGGAAGLCWRAPRRRGGWSAAGVPPGRHHDRAAGLRQLEHHASRLAAEGPAEIRAAGPRARRRGWHCRPRPHPRGGDRRSRAP